MAHREITITKATEERSERIKKIKFFSEKHEILQSVFRDLRTSFWVDVKKDRDIIRYMMEIEKFVEEKLLK